VEAQMKNVQLDNLWSFVRDYYGCEHGVIISKGRTRPAVMVRQVFFYLARRHEYISLNQIGLYSGGRDHSTVIHGVNTIENLMLYDKQLCVDIATLIDNIQRPQDYQHESAVLPAWHGFIAGA
jgi:chromosomal replication initiator protein